MQTPHRKALTQPGFEPLNLVCHCAALFGSRSPVEEDVIPVQTCDRAQGSSLLTDLFEFRSLSVSQLENLRDVDTLEH